MVSTRDRWWLAAALAASLAGCSAEFGGRCEVDDDCSETQVCTQGYCLPDDVEAGPDDGVPDDMGPMSDGAVPDGGPAGDVGPTGDTGSAALCDPVDGVIPAYDPAFGHRVCPDEQTVALWRFEGDFEAVGPNGEAGPALAEGRDRDAVVIEAGGFGRAARFVGDAQRVVGFGVEGDAPYNDHPMTIEMWVRFVAFDDDYQVLMSTLDVEGNGRGGLSLYISRDGERYFFGAAGASRQAQGRLIAATATDLPLTPGAWTHVATRSRSDNVNGLEVYVNGERSDNRTWGWLGSSTMPLRFGEANADEGPRYEGMIDEVRISRAERSRDDLRASAANPPE